MILYEFTKDLETGNATIDREHKELLAAVNKLMEASKSGKGRATMESSIKFLSDYVDRHFAHEEDLQQKSGYPNYIAHKQFHRQYTAKLKEIVSKIPLDNPSLLDFNRFNMHIAQLVTHIKTEDKKLGKFLNEKKRAL